MKNLFIGLVLLAGGAVLSGCMSSRGICAVSSAVDVNHVTTRNKYRISRIQEKLPDGRVVNVHSNARMRELLGKTFNVSDMTSFAPGAWDEKGIPVTVTFSEWSCVSDGGWSIAPCILTLGIFPYCQHDEMCSRVTVARDDGKGQAWFGYTEDDCWKVSFLFPCGHIPYNEKILAQNEFQSRGAGDVTALSHLAGLAHGIVSALAEIESKQNTNQ